MQAGREDGSRTVGDELMAEAELIEWAKGGERKRDEKNYDAV